MEERDLIRAWGTKEQYFAELEGFLKRHENADTKVFDTESKLLVKVEYYFRPYQVAVEQEALRYRIMEANRERVDAATEGGE